jgi:predicted RNase H-like HicB family nuclease
MTHFIGVIMGADDVWAVRVPDLDDCDATGDSAEEAIANAREALREHMADRLRAGRGLAKQRSIVDLMNAGEIDSGDAVALITLPIDFEHEVDAGYRVDASFFIDANLLEAIDEAAKAEGITRSEFLADAAREKLATRR